MKSYHLGFVKDGDTVILEIADSVDQLSCEMWRYIGERLTDIKLVRQHKAELLTEVNQRENENFKRLTIRRIAASDFSAGHIVS